MNRNTKRGADDYGLSLIHIFTEAANETAKVGQVTGPLADALNWAGVSEDEFNKKLATCSTEQERQKLIMDTLNKTYKDASNTYKETNKDVIESEKANQRFKMCIRDRKRMVLIKLCSFIHDRKQHF